jgi:hypothetical protein
VGVATASFLTLVQVGAAVGSAVSGAVWGRLVPTKLREYLPEAIKGEADKIYASVVVACSYPWGSPEREAIARSYQETITVLLWVALVACGPVLGMAMLVGDIRLDGIGKGGSSVRMVDEGGAMREVVRRRVAGTWWSSWWGRPKGRTAEVSVLSVHD